MAAIDSGDLEDIHSCVEGHNYATVLNAVVIEQQLELVCNIDDIDDHPYMVGFCTEKEWMTCFMQRYLHLRQKATPAAAAQEVGRLVENIKLSIMQPAEGDGVSSIPVRCLQMWICMRRQVDAGMMPLDVERQDLGDQRATQMERAQRVHATTLDNMVKEREAIAKANAKLVLRLEALEKRKGGGGNDGGGGGGGGRGGGGTGGGGGGGGGGSGGGGGRGGGKGGGANAKGDKKGAEGKDDTSGGGGGGGSGGGGGGHGGGTASRGVGDTAGGMRSTMPHGDIANGKGMGCWWCKKTDHLSWYCPDRTDGKGFHANKKAGGDGKGDGNNTD
jgi:hypothetical protein